MGGTKLRKGDVVIYNGNTGVYGPKGTRYIVSQVRSGEGKLSSLKLVEFHEEGKPEVLKVLQTTSFPWKNDFIAPVTAPPTPKTRQLQAERRRTREVPEWMRRRLGWRSSRRGNQ